MWKRILLPTVLSACAAYAYAQKPAPPPHSEAAVRVDAGALDRLGETLRAHRPAARPNPQPATSAGVSPFDDRRPPAALHPQPRKRRNTLATPDFAHARRAHRHPPSRRIARTEADLLGLAEREVAAAAEEHLAALDLGLTLGDELELTHAHTDEVGVRHVRLAQHHAGVPVFGQELILHHPLSGGASATGRIATALKGLPVDPTLSRADAADLIAAAAGAPVQYAAGSLAAEALAEVPAPELYVYVGEAAPRLVYVGEAAPSILDHYRVIVDAHTGEVVDRWSIVCTAFAHAHADRSHAGYTRGDATAGPSADGVELPAVPAPATDVLDGTTAQAVDLNGVTRTIQTFSADGTFWLVDASRPMWDPSSGVPQDLRGAIVTLDARNTSPQTDELEVYYLDNAGNEWADRSAVSAHYNSEESYEYFRRAFGRNSIDDLGGSVRAIVNVADEDGGSLANAFWALNRIWYGNGGSSFSPLAASLDVAGHEMSHGVIQATANLEYKDESGALNEHFADVFGVMIDRDDWTLGEEVVNPALYRSGALRDCADPANGGRDLGDPGYQPPTYPERYTGDEDNGGVHINSGIGNNVAYRIAQAIGRAATEQLYYDVLSDYLTRFSDYADYRAALQQRAAQVYGEGSAELAAVTAALDAVGIPGGGSTGDPDDNNQQVNPGDRLYAYLDAEEFAAPLVNEAGALLIDDITPDNLVDTRPSVTDDGSVAAFATDDGDIQLIGLDYATNEITTDVVSGDLDGDGVGDIANAVISRQGNRVALLLEGDLSDDKVYVFDLDAGEQAEFRLYSPNSDGEPVYSVANADAIEFDYSGRYLVYDAFNRVNAGQEPIENWDIGVVEVFDAAGGFADGDVQKLFTTLDPGVNIGNPTLAKNDADLIAYDYFDDDGNYRVLGVNIRTGDQGVFFEGTRLGYPSYDAADAKLYFSAETEGGDPVIGVVSVAADGVSGEGDAVGFVGDASRGTAFANGQRTIITAAAELQAGKPWTVGPNPVRDRLQIFRPDDGTIDTEPFDVFDATGARVATAPASARVITLAHLPSGTYTVTRGSATVTVVKQ